jgi:predicted dehydrogenase
MTAPIRYAIVGAGSRSMMYSQALLDQFRDQGELVAYCDVNPARMAFMNRYYQESLGAKPVATYPPQGFQQMLEEQRVQVVIVCSVDRTHHRYIIQTLEAGRDAITEKPMTIDAEKCQAILDTIARTGRKLRVTFNYRYSPRNSQVKELLASGVIGEVISVHFEWLLDTSHGADYFRRWHRDKRNSGGLMVHKATHHFDLVNWWLGSRPELVFGLGALRYYGRENAEARGVVTPYFRYTGSEAAKSDPFALDLADDETLRALYLEAEPHDGYQRDQNVLGDGISIEDDMAVLVRYASKTTLTYHLTAYSPWEGYRVAFNGNQGRLEYLVVENPFVERAVPVDPRLFQHPVIDSVDHTEIVIYPLFGKPRRVEPAKSSGGHGGGDERLLRDLLVAVERDPLGRAANHVDGAFSILTGIAANQSFATGLPVRIADLVRKDAL